MTTIISLSELNIGDVIYAPVVINPVDLVSDPHATKESTTARAIRNGKAIARICVVLHIGDGVVTVAYMATFKGSATLPFENKQFWYPVTPAEQEGDLEPLPTVNDRAHWVSLRRGHKVTSSEVKKINHMTYSTHSVQLILAAMQNVSK